MIKDFFNQFKFPEIKLVGEFDRFDKEMFGEWEQKITPVLDSWDQQFQAWESIAMDWVNRSNLLFVITAPFIYALWIPAILLDIFLFCFQLFCFPVYGIPRVKRNEYIVIDRHRLTYLNRLEKFNCLFCGYFNGLIAYAREVASRTEQYWCPIKHAGKLKSPHRRYQKFVEYEDEDEYRANLKSMRNSLPFTENPDI